MTDTEKTDAMATVKRYSSYCAVLIPVILALSLLLIAGTYSQVFDGSNSNNPGVGAYGGDILRLESDETDSVLAADRDDYSIDPQPAIDIESRIEPISEPDGYDEGEEEEVPEDSPSSSYKKDSTIPNDDEIQDNDNQPIYGAQLIHEETFGILYSDNDEGDGDSENPLKRGDQRFSQNSNSMDPEGDKEREEERKEENNENSREVKGAKKSIKSSDSRESSKKNKNSDNFDSVEYKNLDYNEEAIDAADKIVQGAKKALNNHSPSNEKKSDTYINVDYSANYYDQNDIDSEKQDAIAKNSMERNEGRNKKRRSDEQTAWKRIIRAAVDADYPIQQIRRMKRQAAEDNVAEKRSAMHQESSQQDHLYGIRNLHKPSKRSSSCSDSEIEYGYGCEDGPERWVEKFPDCSGDRQSPINLETATARIDYEPMISWLQYAALPVKMVLQNEGHTAKLTAQFDETCGGRPSIMNSLTKHEYVFGEIRFHWGANDKSGSEHTINYDKYPLEMHVVHYRRALGGVEQAMGVPGGLCIIALLFQISPHPHTGLKEMQTCLSKIYDAPNEVEMKPFPLIKLVPQFKKHYFTYNGSLTHPPCSETVTWIINQKIGPVSSKQVARFRRLKNDGSHILHNNRPPQPLNKRCIIQVS